MHPQNKFVQGQAPAGQVFPIERCPSCQRGREQVRQGDDNDVGISVLALDIEKPSAPAPPDLLTATNGCGDRLCLLMRGAMNRASTSAPPPGPAGTTNSTGFWGSQAATLPNHTSSIASTPTIGAVQIRCCMWCSSGPTASVELHAVFPEQRDFLHLGTLPLLIPAISTAHKSGIA